jgi:uncharacterized protein
MSEQKQDTQQLPADLLAILSYPGTNIPVTQEGNWVVCREKGVRFPIEQGIPVMLLERAEPLPAEDSATAHK